MTTAKNVWVFVEQEEGRLAEVSLELLAKARALAEPLGGEVWAVLAGHRLGALAETVIHSGADRVLVADHPELARYRTLPYARLLIQLAQARQPHILLIGATPVGRDLAPRVASALRTGLTADCTDLQIGAYLARAEKTTYADLLYQIRPAFGGNLIATIVNPRHRPQMATVREGVMVRLPLDSGRVGVIEPVMPDWEPGDLAVRILDRQTRPVTVDLKGASVVVAGGAGLRGPAEFELVRELAYLLGGEVGASRAAVDAGHVSRDHQVGQTGLTVRPRLYIAVGISGAVQHRAGMDQANKIIAINVDPAAPIFQIAHYKIVGDAAEVLPLLIRALRDKTR